MRRLVILLALVFVVALALPALAGTGNLVYKFNMIGHPNCKTLKGAIGGDTSGGKAIMIPLKNANGEGLPELICPDGEFSQANDDTLAYSATDPAKGAKIYFELGDTFEVVDRDACDSTGAKVIIPGDPSTANWDMYVRVLGKPTKCLSITAYAFDGDQGTSGIWYWAGSFSFKRKFGQATWINVDELFDVYYCFDYPDCTDVQEISVFNDVFESYFWDVLNDGVRLVQVKLVGNVNGQ